MFRNPQELTGINISSVSPPFVAKHGRPSPVAVFSPKIKELSLRCCDFLDLTPKEYNIVHSFVLEKSTEQVEKLNLNLYSFKRVPNGDKYKYFPVQLPFSFFSTTFRKGLWDFLVTINLCNNSYIVGVHKDITFVSKNLTSVLRKVVGHCQFLKELFLVGEENEICRLLISGLEGRNLDFLRLHTVAGNVPVMIPYILAFAMEEEKLKVFKYLDISSNDIESDFKGYVEQKGVSKLLSILLKRSTRRFSTEKCAAFHFQEKEKHQYLSWLFNLKTYDLYGTHKCEWDIKFS